VQLRADCLRRCVADINRQQPDAVIFTGDTVQHGQPEEYAYLRELLAPLEVPLYLVPGNRDDNEALRAAFNDLPYLPVAVGERKGVFCPAREAWLEEVLSEQPDRPTLLFIHHPPFDVGDHYVGGYRRSGEAAALTDLVSRHPQVEGMLCGHVHWPIEQQWAGTSARIMPSVAVDLRKGIDEAEARQQPIYMLHRLSGETGFVSEAKMVDTGA